MRTTEESPSRDPVHSKELPSSRGYSRCHDCFELLLHFRYGGNGCKAAPENILGAFSDRIDAEFVRWVFAVLDGESHCAINHEIDRIAQIRSHPGGSLAAFL